MNQIQLPGLAPSQLLEFSTTVTSSLESGKILSRIVGPSIIGKIFIGNKEH